ncbi:hypothetical protein PR202_ga12189 [Eleusine coracana subsp. coracana]|uniref:MATH domain-containing protein n=1 Tax=Eleusine coracana subsp. coracana TaxID=191504 RepID=A0AAV5CAY5_ELECO|nr:hypothetical protein PR202_ga12189 [Eleusine coracana subsp. coracana]
MTSASPFASSSILIPINLICTPIKFKFSLLDQSGNPVPKFSHATTRFCSFSSYNTIHRFRDFIMKKDLEESECLKDDCFSVRCDITALKNLKKIDDDDDYDDDDYYNNDDDDDDDDR